MISRSILGLLGLFHLVNGLWMLAAPNAWYWAVPGVNATGPINHHFITDIALAFLASGAFMAIGFRSRAVAAAFALAGATWPALHAVFHVWEWLADGFPRSAQIWVSEAFGVVFIGFLGLALAWSRARKEGVV